MDKPKGIATAADFRKMAETSAWEEPKRVVLPASGFTVIVRRPTKLYWALRRSEWPPSLQEKLDSASSGVKPDLTPDETLLLVQEERGMLVAAFVDPEPSPNPGPGQFDPGWLLPEDTDFILKYLRGQVLANGQDLDTFRRSEPFTSQGGSDNGAALRENAG